MAPGSVEGQASFLGFDHDRVEVDHRVQRIQRAGLPGQDFVGDLIGDVADRLVGQFGADRGRQVVLDVPHDHPAGVQDDEHLVQPGHPPRPLGRQRWRECALPFAGHLEAHVLDLGRDRLGCGAVAGVAERRRIRVALVVPQVPGQLGLQPALNGGLDQAGDEPAITGELDLAGVDPGEQIVQPGSRHFRGSTARS